MDCLYSKRLIFQRRDNTIFFLHNEILTCISRPRRFGKSFAAKMHCAYYDCSCDSRGLFDDKEIVRTGGYLTHLNQYHVISIDAAGFVLW